MNLLATEITSCTLISPDRSIPHKRGNCFSVKAGSGEYRIVNFNKENLEYVLTKIEWPIKIVAISGFKAIIHDERIPEKYYDTRYCEICCPESLLPSPQRYKYERQRLQKVRIEDPKLGFVAINYNNSPDF